MYKGLGDTIERFTNITGITKLANKLGDCGCKRRRDFLNTKFPFDKNK